MSSDFILGVWRGQQSETTVTERNSGVFSKGLMTVSGLRCFWFRVTLADDTSRLPKAAYNQTAGVSGQRIKPSHSAMFGDVMGLSKAERLGPRVLTD